MKNIFSLIKNNRDKIEKFGAWMFFLSAIIFIGSLIILFIFFYFLTKGRQPSENAGGGFVFILLFMPEAIISIILALIGDILSVIILKPLFILMFAVTILLFCLLWIPVLIHSEPNIYIFFSALAIYACGSVLLLIKSYRQ